jgi:hypothetical protein
MTTNSNFRLIAALAAGALFMSDADAAFARGGAAGVGMHYMSGGTPRISIKAPIPGGNKSPGTINARDHRGRCGTSGGGVTVTSTGSHGGGSGGYGGGYGGYC